MRTNPVIIAALDAPSPFSLLTALPLEVQMLKVGLTLVNAIGLPLVFTDILDPNSARWARVTHGLSARVSALSCPRGIMLDLKLSDIPNTVASTIRVVGSLDFDHRVRWVTVHANAGEAALQAAVEEAAKFGIGILAVTVLTSIAADECRDLYGCAPEEAVQRMANTAVRAGVAGLVSSPRELSLLVPLRKASPQLVFVTPGVRPPWAPDDDQARVMTPKAAGAAGADYVVIGRPLWRPPNPMTCHEAYERMFE